MTTIEKCVIILSLLTVAYSKSVRQTVGDIEDVEKYIESKKPEINQRYRPLYHIAGPVGWINDPNGFSYYKRHYHLFYQFYPYDSVWGPMHWGHVTSRDLVTWKQEPTALVPEKEQCFSGSAVVDGDRMILMYTGHEITDTEPHFNQTQYLAFSDDGVVFEKYEGNPVITAAPNGSPDFRDPKAWKHGDYWYVVLGSKTLDDRGRVLLYRSGDMIHWEFLTVLAESNGDLGYMWECPDFFELDGKYVLLISPQGMEPKGDRYKNTHQTGYIIGDFNYDTFEFVPEADFQELDFGHDFYAAQTTEVNKKRYLVAWFNMWEMEHPEDVDGWAGMMTLVRQLRLSDNRILQTPVEAITSLRYWNMIASFVGPDKDVGLGTSAEVIIEGDLSEMIELSIEGQDGGSQVWILWDPEVEKVSIDRGSGDIRQVEWHPKGSTSWRIFMDASSLELFCGDGEVVFSSRVYPVGKWRLVNWSFQTLFVRAYALKRSVPV